MLLSHNFCVRLRLCSSLPPARRGRLGLVSELLGSIPGCDPRLGPLAGGLGWRVDANLESDPRRNKVALDSQLPSGRGRRLLPPWRCLVSAEQLLSCIRAVRPSWSRPPVPVATEASAVFWHIGEVAMSAVPSRLPDERVPRRHAVGVAVLSREGVAVDVAVLVVLGLWRVSPYSTHRQGRPE